MRSVFIALALLATAQTRIPVISDGSGTVTTGGTSRQVFAANDGRNYLFCQNPIDATEKLTIDFGRAASLTTGAIELAPGGSINFLGAAVPIASVNVNAATSGHRYVCKQGGNN